MYDAYHLISTPENVDLRLELAGMGNRVLACFIDTFLSYCLIFLVWTALLLGAFGTAWLIQRLKFNIEPEDFSRGFIILSALGTLASFLIAFGYFIFFEGIWQGQTPGKKIAGIRVVRENGEPVSWMAVLLRNILRTFDESVFMIGLLFMVIEKDEKRMGDLAAGTVVIRERKSIQPQVTKKNDIVSGAADEFTERLSLSDLGEGEYELLTSFLKRRKFMLKPQRADLAKKLATRLFSKLNHDEQKSQPVNSEAYLEEIAAKL